MFYFGAKVVAQITLESFIVSSLNVVSNVTLKPLFPGPMKKPWDPPKWTLTLEVLKLDVFPPFVDDLVVVPLELDLLLGLLAVGAIVEGLHGPLAVVLLADHPKGFHPLLLCVAREVALLRPF